MKIQNQTEGDTTLIRGIFYTGFLFEFAFASLSKVFHWKEMMDGMVWFGFSYARTTGIGYAELLGVIGLILGLFYPLVLRLSVLWLLPFSLGAFSVHMSRSEYHNFYNALFCCIAGVMLLLTDKRLHIIYDRRLQISE